MKKIKNLAAVLFCMIVIAMLFNPDNANASSVKVGKQTIYNKNGFDIGLDSFKETKNKYEMKFIVKNKTKHTFRVYIDEYAVNEISFDSDNSGVNVMGGNNAMYTFKISKSTLKKHYVSSVAKKIDMVMILSYQDSDDDSIAIHKTIRTNKDNKVYTKIKAKKIYSDANMDVSYIKKSGNNFYYLVKNKSKEVMHLSVDSCSVNNWSYSPDESNCEGTIAAPVIKGTSMIMKIHVGNSFMKKYNLKKVNKLEFILGGDDDMTGWVIFIGQPDIQSGKIVSNV